MYTVTINYNNANGTKREYTSNYYQGTEADRQGKGYITTNHAQAKWYRSLRVAKADAKKYGGIVTDLGGLPIK